MPRFFRRLAEGVFDLDDLRRRTDELADFVDGGRRSYDLGPAPPIAVGFSNGANIAAAMLLLRPGTLGGGLLLRPMVPLVPDPLPRPRWRAGPDQRRRGGPDRAASAERSLGELLRRAGADGLARLDSRRPRPHAGRSRHRREVSRGDRASAWLTLKGRRKARAESCVLRAQRFLVRSFFSFARARRIALVSVAALARLSGASGAARLSFAGRRQVGLRRRPEDICDALSRH